MLRCLCIYYDILIVVVVVKHPLGLMIACILEFSNFIVDIFFD